MSPKKERAAKTLKLELGGLQLTLETARSYPHLQYKKCQPHERLPELWTTNARCSLTMVFSKCCEWDGLITWKINNFGQWVNSILSFHNHGTGWTEKKWMARTSSTPATTSRQQAGIGMESWRKRERREINDYIVERRGKGLISIGKVFGRTSRKMPESSPGGKVLWQPYAPRGTKRIKCVIPLIVTDCNRHRFHIPLFIYFSDNPHAVTPYQRFAYTLRVKDADTLSQRNLTGDYKCLLWRHCHRWRTFEFGSRQYHLPCLPGSLGALAASLRLTCLQLSVALPLRPLPGIYRLL